MKKIFSGIAAIVLLTSTVTSFAEKTQSNMSIGKGSLCAIGRALNNSPVKNKGLVLLVQYTNKIPSLMKYLQGLPDAKQTRAKFKRLKAESFDERVSIKIKCAEEHYQYTANQQKDGRLLVFKNK